MNESEWIHRAQTAEAKLRTREEQTERLKEESRQIKEFFGARKLADGGYDIDFEVFVDRLGLENALQVRAIIDERYGVSGAAGEKPRVRMKAAS